VAESRRQDQHSFLFFHGRQRRDPDHGKERNVGENRLGLDSAAAGSIVLARPHDSPSLTTRQVKGYKNRGPREGQRIQKALQKGIIASLLNGFSYLLTNDSSFHCES